MKWRIRLGRYLLRPVTADIIDRYKAAAKRLHAEGHHRRAEHCEYIVIGAMHVGLRDNVR